MDLYHRSYYVFIGLVELEELPSVSRSYYVFIGLVELEELPSVRQIFRRGVKHSG